MSNKKWTFVTDQQKILNKILLSYYLNFLSIFKLRSVLKSLVDHD